MFKETILAATTAVLMFFNGALMAMEDGPGEKPGKMMEQADTNHDGKISADEFKAAHDKRSQEHFKKMDANGDGFIDKEEMKKGREQMREKMKERMEHRQEMREKMKESKPQ